LGNENQTPALTCIQNICFDRTMSLAMSQRLLRGRTSAVSPQYSDRYTGGVWATPLPRPLVLPGRTVIGTLGSAAAYVFSLPKRRADQPAWRLATAGIMTAWEKPTPESLAEARMLILRALES
jgi:hypothetical protein